MKKIVALTLACLIVVSALCACGGKGAGTTSLHLNETFLWGDFELKILDVRYCEDGFSVNYSTGAQKYSGTSVAVTYSLKNVGKTAGAPDGSMMQLNYADGYSFFTEVKVNGNHENIYANGGINTPTELPVLSDEHYYLESFTVPEQVIEDKESPLFLTLAYADSVEDSPFRYDIRPADDIQKDALYQHALDLMDEGRFSTAFAELEDIIDYKDVTDLRTKCAVNSYGSKYSDYLMEHMDEFETLTDAALSDALVGTWRSIDYAETWVFAADGTLDPGRTAPIDGSKITGEWSVSGDVLKYTMHLANGHADSYEYKIKQVGDYGFLLFTEKSGAPSINMKLAK